MSGVLRHWQQEEWSARALWVFSESIKAKTFEYNPSADDWEIFWETPRPEFVDEEWVGTCAPQT